MTTLQQHCLLRPLLSPHGPIRLLSAERHPGALDGLRHKTATSYVLTAFRHQSLHNFLVMTGSWLISPCPATSAPRGHLDRVDLVAIRMFDDYLWAKPSYPASCKASARLLAR